MRKPQTLFASLLCVAVLSGCTTVRPNQKWPMLPEYPRPDVPKVSKVELMNAISALPAGEDRERVRLLANDVVGDLVETWRDFTFWGDRMDAIIRQYNKEAKKHNKRVD